MHVGGFLLIRQDGKSKAAEIGGSWSVCVCVCVSSCSTGSCFDINCKREVRLVGKAQQKGGLKKLTEESYNALIVQQVSEHQNVFKQMSQINKNSYVRDNAR